MTARQKMHARRPPRARVCLPPARPAPSASAGPPSRCGGGLDRPEMQAGRLSARGEGPRGPRRRRRRRPHGRLGSLELRRCADRWMQRRRRQARQGAKREGGRREGEGSSTTKKGAGIGGPESEGGARCAAWLQAVQTEWKVLASLLPPFRPHFTPFKDEKRNIAAEV